MCINCNIFPEGATFVCPVCGKNEVKIVTSVYDANDPYYHISPDDDYWHDISEGVYDSESY